MHLPKIYSNNYYGCFNLKSIETIAAAILFTLANYFIIIIVVATIIILKFAIIIIFTISIFNPQTPFLLRLSELIIKIF